MKKRYSSPSLKFTVNLKKEGKSFPVVFDQFDRERKRRFVIVADEEIQKQLEGNRDFRVYFTLDADYHDPDYIPEPVKKVVVEPVKEPETPVMPEVPEEPVVVPVETETPEEPEIPETPETPEEPETPVLDPNVHEEETLPEAKKYLASLGVKTYPSMNKVKAIEAAKSIGIELIIKN